MNRTKWLFLFLWIACSLITEAQEVKTISGSEKFSQTSKSCFNKVDWSMNYKYDCSDTETGTFTIIFSDAKFSIASAKLMYKGKEFSPSDAGLNEWPEEYTKNLNIKFNLAVMHGEILLHEEQAYILNGSGKRIRVGLYRGGFFNTVGENSKKLQGINYKNCTIKVTNITSDGCYQGSLPIIDLLKAKKKID